MELNKHVEQDAAVLLYGNAISGILITLLTSSFLVFAFDNPQTADFKTVWWPIMAAVLSLRFIDAMWWNFKEKNTDFDGKKAITRFIIGVNSTAIVWTTYLVYATTHSSGIELTTTVITVASMAGGAATILAAHKYTSMFYPVILLVPGAIGLLFSDIEALQLLGVLGLAFGFVMLATSKKSADFTRNALFLKNENAVLVHRMEEKVKQRTQKIYELSNLDPLTGLYNRTAFLDALKMMVSKPIEPFSLLFIDLDGFKKINDSIGHKAGDQILKKTANRLKAYTLESQLLCRWGGDEFIIVFTNTRQSSAIEKSKQLIEKLSEHHKIENSVLSVGATIGIALYPEHATTEDRLIQLADMAMYFQKKQMRSTVAVFSEQMEKLYSKELRLKNGLTKAIEQHQLRIVYQPIIRSEDNTIAAFEALLRWRNEDENIPPDEFIPIAEQYGLIHEIGAWVLNHACQQASQWGLGRNVAVCVNVSVIQFQNENFINVVENALLNSGLPAELLHLEITESVFAADFDSTSNLIKQLQRMGIKVSIDDFGTGYSSLSVLQDLAVNMVKIDRSFVAKMDSNGAAIVTAVINIADSFNFLVIAEGVETEKQTNALKKLGVQYLQGYFHSRPLEVENIPSYLQSGVSPSTTNLSHQVDQRGESIEIN
ncbi:EAL domain-containing protein [Psychrosphaera sp. B3R10]|nr:EAL domain-containing protein [Psychrosphaera sp. I2R16]MBU2989115.1 EAL domain-containing protein [Psychrosphaera sp. B3R10]